MKNAISTILFLLTVTTYSTAQCGVADGSFENWSFVPVELEDGAGTIYTNNVQLPDSTTSVLRFLFIAFELFFDPSLGLSFTTDPQGVLGIEQSTDASDGEFAVKLQAAYNISVADIFSPRTCSEVADSFSLDVKHVGNADDTLSVFVIFDEGLAPLPEDEDALQDYPAYAYGQFVYNSDSAYHRITLPVIENFVSNVDTFYYLIIAETDEDSYFLIDNIKMSPTDDNTVCSFDNYPSFSLTQTKPVCICDDDFSSFDEEGTFTAGGITQDTVPPLFIVLNQNDEIQYISEGDINALFQEDFCPEENDELFLVQILYESATDIDGVLVGNSLTDITGCHAVSEKMPINTIYEFFQFEMFRDNEILDDEELVVVCNFDDIIETFSFNNPTILLGTVFVINAENDIIVEQFSAASQNTTFDLPAGDYYVGLAASLNIFPNVLGLDVEILGESLCWYGSDNFYDVQVLENGDDACISSIKDQEILSNVRILQNPVHESLTLKIKENINKNIKFSIYDLNGSLLLERETDKLLNDVTFDVSSFGQGIYFLQLQSADGIASFKFIKS